MNAATPRLPLIMSAVLALLTLAGPARAKTVYVDRQAPGPVYDGASWDTAFRAIQTGVDAAAPGDSVWVRYDSYSGTVVIRAAGVTVLGGFLGGETEAAQRRPYARPIINCRDLPGAGVAINADDVTLDGFEITRTTLGSGPPETATGPGIFVAGKSATISGSVITGHTGGGIVCAASADSVTLSDNIISGNHATQGGGVSCGNATLLRNVIMNNYAEAVGNSWARGGGVYVGRGTVLMKDNLIARNVALAWSTSYGPGYLGDARGGGVAIGEGTARMLNNTVADNAAVGGAEARGGAVALGDGTLELTNNLFARNVAAPFAGSGRAEGGVLWLNNDPYDSTPPTAKGRNNLVFQNTPDDTLPDGVAENLNADPAFAFSNDYHLKAGSPAIDAGDSAAVAADDRDVGGQPRILGPAVDIGAYESPLTVAPRTQARTYTRPNGSDRNTGASWEEAKGTLGSALSVTAAGGEVWAMAGRYTERLTMPDGVSVYGGFTGTETERNQRDFRADPTVLDAEYRGNAVIIPSGTSNVTLDGLTIRHGRAVLNFGYPDPYGAGIHSEGEQVTVASCTVEDNEYQAHEDNPIAWGGGIYATGGSITIRNSIIRRNHLRVTQGLGLPQFGNIAEGDGAGVALVGGDILVANNLIAANDITLDGLPSQQAPLGSGLFCQAVTGSIVNNTFVQNTSTPALYVSDGGFDRVGGAVHLRPSRTPIAFVNNIVAFNSTGLANHAEGLLISHNDVFGNGTDWQGGDPTGTNGNISKDPLFADRAAGDFRLAPVSPGVDTGDGALAVGDADLDGRPRILGAYVDMGAYETPADVPLTMGDAAGALRVAAGLSGLPAEALSRLDVDGGGVVDIADAAAIARAVAGR